MFPAAYHFRNGKQPADAAATTSRGRQSCMMNDKKKNTPEHMHYYRPDPDHTDEDHHVGPDYEGPLEEHPLWQRDNVILTSVGIDIGSAGTQIIFSRMHLQRQSVDLSSRYLVIARETWYESPVSFTPYRSDTLIDARALGTLVDEAYRSARVTPDEIDTGVVILTGEALRRENAERIARILSEKCGDLVCATAGHHMEAMLAAHGSGALQASHDRDERILNIDIGGGTTKLGVLEKGRILSTAALHIGGRLLAVDDSGRIVHLDPAGRLHMRRAGLDRDIGDKVSGEELAAVTESMADDLVAALTMRPPPPGVMDLYLTDPVSDLDGVTSVIFSGGVAEFIYAREERDFGDLGRRLGLAIRRRVDAGDLPWALLSDSQGIRATALGASEYTVQLSGNTGYISDPATLLPRRNLQVLRPDFDFTDSFSPESLAGAVRQHLETFDVAASGADFVLAFHWRGLPDYRRIRDFAEGIHRGVAGRLEQRRPLYVILDADVAMTLGNVLHEEFAVDTGIMVIDGVALWDFDYVDIGRMRQPSGTVPVTIKSLVFNDVLEGPHRHEHVHHIPGDNHGP